jgi:hypothetical protein
MRRTVIALSCLASAAALSASMVTAAAPSPLAAPTPTAAWAVERVQFWDVGRCRSWRRECADRWGWRSDRWYRCLARHGCERHRYGDRWDR